MASVSLFGEPLNMSQINAAAAVRDYSVQPNIGTFIYWFMHHTFHSQRGLMILYLVLIFC